MKIVINLWLTNVLPSIDSISVISMFAANPVANADIIITAILSSFNAKPTITIKIPISTI